MRLALVALMAAASFGSAYAQAVYVQPHIRSDGTFVQGHFRSRPDHTPLNNYGTQGNMNPYTGRLGTVNPLAAPIQPLQPAYPRAYPPAGSMYAPPSEGLGGLRGRAF